MLAAQAPPADSASPPATGSVWGHVYYGDTHLPARMASVELQPVNLPDVSAPKSFTTNVIQTLLDGSFTIPNVAPGEYYVVAEKPGYLSPLAQFSREEMDRPTKEDAASMSALVAPILVVAGRTTTAEVTLQRGAVIAGTVRFDDGTPDIDADVELQRKGKDGKWASFRTNLLGFGFSGSKTDDQGHFRMAGLPAGEYQLMTLLSNSITTVQHQGNSSSSSTSSGQNYSLSVYLGDGFRRRDAKSIKLNAGEESSGNDIEVRLTRLHSLSGTVVNQAGAEPNAGQVVLAYADDGTVIARAMIDPRNNDPQFHFLYVPEGEYLLETTAADVVLTPAACSDCKDSPPPTQKILRTYGGSQPITINGEMNGVTVKVKPAPLPAGATGQ